MAVTNTNLIVEMTAEADVLTGTFFIDHIEWIAKASSAGDDLLIVDAGTKKVVAGVADVANYSKTYDVRKTVKNLTVSTMDTGYIIVYAYSNPNFPT